MRKCDSCLYGEKLYDGTLICQHIVSMQGREATQDYVICNRVAKEIHTEKIIWKHWKVRICQLNIVSMAQKDGELFQS